MNYSIDWDGPGERDAACDAELRDRAVEAVARAICDRNPDAQVTLWHRERLMERLTPARYSMAEGETVPAWKLFEHKARAAIAAYEAVTRGDCRTLPGM